MRRLLLALALALGCAGCRTQQVEPEPRQPNILLLLADDLRANSIGDPRVRTPNLDLLARQGARFERAYCMGSLSGAVCGPSRAMLLSGRGLFRLPRNPFDLDESLPLWPELLRRSGYRTFGTGKWHNGKRSFARCFDDGGAIFFGGMGSHWELPVHDFDPTGEYANDRRRPLSAHSSETFASQAVRFLESYDGEQPFCLYVAFTAPHDPRTAPEAVRAGYDPALLELPPNFLPDHPFDNGELSIRDEELAPHPRTPEVVREHLADYYAMITHLDAEIGRILDALEASGHGRDTYVIFSSDHGLAVGSHGLMGKQNLYEHSMRAPLIVRGPGIVPERRVRQLTYLHDLAPTMCALAGVPAPERCDGRNLSALLFGRPTAWRDSILTAYKDGQRALCGERMKLIEYPAADRKQLFDLVNDPHETEDLSGDPRYAGVLRSLEGKLREEQQRAGEAPLDH